MSLIDNLTSLFAPYICLGCGDEGMIVCTNCLSSLPPLPKRCFRCRKLSEKASCCTNCYRVTGLRAVHVATVYEGLTKSLVWELKFQGVQAAARTMAQTMTGLVSPDQSAIIVAVPTATKRARGRGYDQADLLARAVARRTGLPLAPALSRLGQTHQVGAQRQQRLSQLSQAFRVTKPRLIQGKEIILIDDVLTTGGTISAAARALKAAGAKQVDALIFAQA